MNPSEKQLYKQPENITKRTALFVATFAAFLTPFMGSALNIALPSIGKDFNADAISINWIASAYILATLQVHISLLLQYFSFLSGVSVTSLVVKRFLHMVFFALPFPHWVAAFLSIPDY